MTGIRHSSADFTGTVSSVAMQAHTIRRQVLHLLHRRNCAGAGAAVGGAGAARLAAAVRCGSRPATGPEGAAHACESRTTARPSPLAFYSHLLDTAPSRLASHDPRMLLAPELPPVSPHLLNTPLPAPRLFHHRGRTQREGVCRCRSVGCLAKFLLGEATPTEHMCRSRVHSLSIFESLIFVSLEHSECF